MTRCTYYDCRWPLVGMGTCTAGNGNPSCVRRGPRLVRYRRSDRPPLGWLYAADGSLEPDPATHLRLAQVVGLVDAGAAMPDIARGLRLSLVYVRQLAKCAGARLDRQRRAMIAASGVR